MRFCCTRLIGLIVWPGPRPGGLLGVRGARIAWAALWLVMAWLWLEAPSSGANATLERDQGGALGDELVEQPAGMGREGGPRERPADRPRARAGLGGDRHHGGSRLARAAVPGPVDRAQPGLLGARTGLRRDLRRWRDRPERGSAVRCAGARARLAYGDPVVQSHRRHARCPRGPRRERRTARSPRTGSGHARTRRAAGRLRRADKKETASNSSASTSASSGASTTWPADDGRLEGNHVRDGYGRHATYGRRDQADPDSDARHGRLARHEDHRAGR